MRHRGGCGIEIRFVHNGGGYAAFDMPSTPDGTVLFVRIG